MKHFRTGLIFGATASAVAWAAGASPVLTAVIGAAVAVVVCALRSRL
jgi:hypothetical protein